MNDVNNEYDIVIIGAGVAGYSAAIKAVERNQRVALIESNQLGGTCLNRGCIPTKAFLFYARNYENAYRMYNAGIFNEAPSMNVTSIVSGIENTTGELRKGLAYTLKHRGVNIFEGRASILRQNIVKVIANDGRVSCIKARAIIIATGSNPMIGDVRGLESAFIESTDSIFSKGTLMAFDVITIVGCGVIGIEFANAFSMFGKKVYVIEKLDRVLSTFPVEISKYVENLLRKRGVTIVCGAEIESIDEEDDEIIVKLNSPSGDHMIFSDRLVFATGRIANTEILNESEISIKMNGNQIKVDKNYETSVKGIYAIGDVSSKIQLAYIASKQAEDVVDYIVDGKQCKYIEHFPQCVYMSPEIASVGLSEEDIVHAGQKCIVGKASMSINGKSVLEGHTDGFIKIIMDFHTHAVIGGQFICENAVELSELLFQYISNQETGESILQAVFPHPSIVEQIKTAVFNGLNAGE